MGRTGYKIALVCDWYAPRLGGIESQLVDLGRELRARGHDPHVITATPGNSDESEVPVHRLEVPLLPGWQVIRNREPLSALEELFARERFDVVHGHSLYSPLALASMWLARRRGVPSVLTSHSLLDPAGMFVLRSLARARGWGRWPDVLSAVSTVAADELRTASEESDVLVLRNGIRAGEWAAPPREPRERVEIITVSRLHRKKRPLDLIAAIPEVLAACPRAHFTLVGDGPLRFALEREAEALGVRRHVTFAGAQPRTEVRRLLAGADLFALPTVKEAFGIAVLEARAAGLPVVAMRAGGVGDVIEHGREGFLAEDRGQFAGALSRLAVDAELRRRMSEAAPRGLERFGWERVVDQHVDLYALAIERARGEKRRAA